MVNAGVLLEPVVGGWLCFLPVGEGTRACFVRLLSVGGVVGLQFKQKLSQLLLPGSEDTFNKLCAKLEQ